jgi:hypothetical protein
MILAWVRRTGTAVFAIAIVSGASAQGLPPPPPAPSAGAVCVRLEAQLAALDRSGADAGRADQLRRYEEAAARQQQELDRYVAHGRKTGCEGSGFFLFGGGQPAQCDQINGQIQRMRANLAKIQSDMQRMQGSRPEVEGQRRALLIALGDNNCGPQYRSASASVPGPAAPPRSRGIFDTLFGGGGGSDASSPQMPGSDIPPDVQPSGTFRTVCVRTCDGFYFPISYATVPSKFPADEHACQQMCPASEARLYSYRNPGEDISRAVSVDGRPYTELPNAYKFRAEFNAACSCKRDGESWADAMKNVEDATTERGDIIVTEQSSKALAQPQQTQPQPVSAEGRPNPAAKGKANPKAKAAPAAVTTAPLPPPAAEPPPMATPPAEPGKRSVRAVGPQFLPVR